MWEPNADEESGVDLATRWKLPAESRYEQLAAGLVRIPTHTPEGAQTGLRFVADRVGRDRIAARLLSATPTDVLELSLGDRGPLVMWLAHIDTVSPSRDDHCTPVVKDGRLYGLGAVDTKGAIAAVMLALPTIAQLAREVGIRFRLVLVGDEEGLTDDRHTIVQYAADCGEVPSVVLAGEPTRGLVSRASKGLVGVAVGITGRSAHGARPHLGLDAIHWGAQIRSLVPQLPLARYRDEAFPDGPVILNSCFNGGGVLNKVPDRCELKFAIRTLPGQRGIVEQIREACEKALPRGMTAEVTRCGPHFEPVAVDRSDRRFTTLRDVVASELPAGADASTTQSGASDLGLLDWPEAALMEWGVPGAGHHGEDEHFVLGGLRRYSGQLVEYLERLARLGMD